MTARRAIIGVCAVCALLVSAVAAQGAGAVGTTANTCSANAQIKDKGDADCTTAGGLFGHTAIPINLKTELSVTGKTGILKATLAGVPVELVAHQVTTGPTENWIENKEAAGEMFVRGEGTLTFSEVTVNISNCDIVGLGLHGGTNHFSTKPLITTTQGQGDAMKFAPVVPPVIAEFEFASVAPGVCPLAGLKVTVTGSFIGTPNGAFVEMTHLATTTQNTLKMNGAKAGIEAKLTFEGRANPAQAYTALSFTTSNPAARKAARSTRR